MPKSNFQYVYFGFVNFWENNKKDKMGFKFNPLYELKEGVWQKINFEYSPLKKYYNNIGLIFKDREFDIEEYRKINIFDKHFYVIGFNNKDIVQSYNGNNNLELSKIEKQIFSLKEFNIYPLCVVNKNSNLDEQCSYSEKIFIENNYSIFKNELLYLYSEDTNQYYGPYNLTEKDNHLCCSTLNNGNNFLVNVFAKNETTTILGDFEDFKFFLVTEKPTKVLDSATQERMYEVFESFLDCYEEGLNCKENIISLIIKSKEFFLYNLPTEIKKRREDVWKKATKEFSSNLENLDKFSDKIIRKVIRNVFSEPKFKNKDYYKKIITKTIDELQSCKEINAEIQRECEKRRNLLLEKVEKECDRERKEKLTKVQKEINDGKIELRKITIKSQNEQKQLETLEKKKNTLNTSVVLLEERLQTKENILQKLINEKENVEKEIQDLKNEEDEIKNLKKELENALQETVNKYNNVSGLVFKNELDKSLAYQINNLFNKEINKEIVESLSYETVSLKVNKRETLEQKELLNYLVKEIQRFRPNYSKNEIVNILLCIMQGFITVFSGSPGTGKTSICKIVSHVLGLDKEFYSNDYIKTNRFVSVSVEKGWNSKRDFIGYYNPLTGIVEKNNVKLYDLLKINDVEIKNKEIVFPSIVLLDEANLSPMEYYWSDFIKICDDNSGNETIDLGNGEIIFVSNCLRFLATINNDHTVETLSPRVISRAFIVSLPKNTKGTLKAREISKEDNYKPIKWEELEKLFFVEEDIDFLKGIKEIFEDIKDICYELQPNMISARIEKAVEKYCSVASHNDLFENENNINSNIIALDFVVLQKVLPQIHGNGETYKNNLVKLKEYLKEKGLIRSYEKVSVILESEKQNFGTFNFFN